MKSTYQIGLLAEWLCVLRLWLTGWRILARRWQHPLGEIDLIACRRQVVAFIEVKARKSRAQALESVRPPQRQRIVRAAQAWIGQYPEYAGFCLRFDIMWVTGWPWPQRLSNAWQLQK